MTTIINPHIIWDPNRRIKRNPVERPEALVHHKHLRDFPDPGASFFFRKNNAVYSVSIREKESSTVRVSTNLKDFANQLAII